MLKRIKHVIVIMLIVTLCFAAVACTPAAKATSTSGLRPEGVPADYPNKEIVWIRAGGPGSAVEAYFRMLADKIQEMEGWKHGFIVDYKEGASGRIGYSALATAKPDGYTTGFCPSAMLISSTSDKNVPYGYDKTEYIINSMTDPGAIAVVADSKYQTLTDLVEDAKANPDEIIIGVSSIIGQEGLTVKLIQKASGAKFKIVAFNSSGELQAVLLGKHVDALCLNVTDFTAALADKTVRVIATGDEKRSAFLPDVPTYIESGYDVTQVNMRAFGVPKGTPEPIRQYLENCFIAAANDPGIQEKAKEMQLPIDTLNGADTKVKFTTIAENLQKLWNEDPWQ